jgi:filamentous hemagglutinin family protein
MSDTSDNYYIPSSNIYLLKYISILSIISTSAIIISSLQCEAQTNELPQGASVGSGDVQISTLGNDMLITQGSDKAILNWGSFSVGSNNSVQFVQPDHSSAILNRVTGSTRSSIAGSITANGEVFLVNPNGIAITPTGTVRVDSGFVASTLGIKDDDFLSGNALFEGKGASAEVRNDGLIAVPSGKVGIGSGEQAVLDFSGDGFLQVAIPTQKANDVQDALIESSGDIHADGGTVVLAATARQAARKAVNLSGVKEAKTVSGKNGSITIGGGQGGSVQISGKLTTTSTAGKGGNVTVTGKSIQLAKATIDASGNEGGRHC